MLRIGLFLSIWIGIQSPPLTVDLDTASGRIAYAALNPDQTNLDIYVIDADGSNKIQLTDSPGDDFDMDWSPDGTQIIFRSTRDGYDGLYLMNADGSNQRPFLENPQEQKRSPAWSPDGKQIAFAAYVPDTEMPQNIHIADVNGEDRRQLTQFAFPDFAEYPSWSPDGTQLVFLAATPSIKQVFKINVDGTHQTQLTQGAWDNDYPIWSPDGNGIVFKSERDGDREIYMMNVDGSEQINLTNSPDTEDTFPGWSPDGTQIIYSSDGEKQSGLFIMNVDGSNKIWLVEGIMPVWYNHIQADNAQ